VSGIRALLDREEVSTMLGPLLVAANEKGRPEGRPFS
jgi:hypothetical protein